MFRRFGPNYMLMLYLFDLGGSQIALWVAHHLRLMLPLSQVIPERGAAVPAPVHQLVLAVFAIILPMSSLYDSRRVFRAVNEAVRAFSAVVLSSLILAGILYVTYRDVSRLVFVYFVVVTIMLLLGYRAALRMLSRIVGWAAEIPVRVLIAGSGPLGRQAARTLTSTGVAIAGFADDDLADGVLVDGIPVLTSLDKIPYVLEQEAVTDIVFALSYHEQDRLANLLVSLWRLPLRIYTIPDIFSLGFARGQVDYLGGLTVLGFREPVVDGFRRVTKRLVDLVLGTAILMGVLPVMGIIAAAIRLESPGPIIFRQERVGENGRPFVMFKFRSMLADAERQQESMNVYTPSGKLVHKNPEDPRVTRVGRFLRRFSLDELPQLFNVLRGEMSLVGPRPELPWIVAQYEPWQYQRLAVPPGMTSWYVVNGRSETPMHLNTEEDLKYVRDYSLLQDLRILWKSLGAVVKGRGAF